MMPNIAEELEHWILKSVQSHDGQWYWWHMDRALATQGKIEWLSHLVPTIEGLVKRGLLEYVEREGADPSIKYCKLTAHGLHAIHG
jgi:hypothetical protein